MKKSDELKWQAEDDASTMARYQEIMGDPSRMKRAIKVAQDKARDLQKRAALMDGVANSGRKQGNRSRK